VERGFVTSLMDFSFSEFVTPRIVSVLYMIGIIMTGMLVIAIVISSFKLDTTAGLFALLLSPLIIIINVIMLRLWLEVIVVLFKIHGGIMALRSTGAMQNINPSQSSGRNAKLDIEF